jgi:hypothetical protein
MTLAVAIIYTASVTVGVADEMAHLMFEASCEEMRLPQMECCTMRLPACVKAEEEAEREPLQGTVRAFTGCIAYAEWNDVQ